MMEDKQRSNMVPVAVIAVDICRAFGDSTRKYFEDHLINLINAYKDFHIFLRQEVSVRTVVLPPDNIVQLPCDFIRETKVGIINEHGRIAVMSVDRNLRVPATVSQDSELEEIVEDIFEQEKGNPDFTFYNYFSGGNYGELYGYARSINTLGYYNVNRSDNTLMVSNSFRHHNNNVVLEYITDGVSDGLRLIPSELVNSLTNKAKSMWCLDKGDPRFETYNNQYMMQYLQIKRLYRAKPIDFYAEIFKQNHQFAPK